MTLRTRSILLSAAVVVALTAAGVLAVERLRPPGSSPVAARARPSSLPAGPADAARTAVGADGARIFCPTGAAPQITVNEAVFDPPLHDGRSFGPGRYRIRLTGLVLNETTASIAVDAYTVTVGGAAWPVKVDAPAAVAAGTSQAISLDGTYDSAAPAQADLHVGMQWVWAAPALRPCGQRGLVEDD